MVTVVHASKKNFSVIVLTSQKVWILVWLQAQTFELGYFNLHTKIVIIDYLKKKSDIPKQKSQSAHPFGQFSMHGQFLAQSTWSWLHFILQLKSLISHSTIQCDKLVRHFVVHSTEASASLKMKSLFLFPSLNHFYMQSLYATLRIITGRIIFNGSN